MLSAFTGFDFVNFPRTTFNCPSHTSSVHSAPPALLGPAVILHSCVCNCRLIVVPCSAAASPQLPGRFLGFPFLPLLLLWAYVISLKARFQNIEADKDLRTITLVYS